MRRRKNQNRRRGFASTLLVLAVMVSVSVLGVLCVQTLVRAHRQAKLSRVQTQLEWMVVASTDWLAAGGQVGEGEGVTITLPSSLPTTDDEMRCEVQLVKQQSAIAGLAVIQRGDRRIGSRHFQLRLENE
jgi:hypothetical protein